MQHMCLCVMSIYTRSFMYTRELIYNYSMYIINCSDIQTGKSLQLNFSKKDIFLNILM